MLKKGVVIQSSGNNQLSGICKIKSSKLLYSSWSNPKNKTGFSRTLIRHWVPEPSQVKFSLLGDLVKIATFGRWTGKQDTLNSSLILIFTSTNYQVKLIHSLLKLINSNRPIAKTNFDSIDFVLLYTLKTRILRSGSNLRADRIMESARNEKGNEQQRK